MLFNVEILVVFAALSYIDNHKDKKNSIPPPKVNAISQP